MTEIKTRRLLFEMDHADQEIRGWLSALPDPDYFPPETTDNEPDDKVNGAGQCT
jgi:hypothetical protein